MCWKQEWAHAIHNIALAIIHVRRAEAKLQKRLERSERWLEKWSQNRHAGPKGIAEIKTVIERNQTALAECREIEANLRQRAKQLMQMIEVYGFKKKEDPNRTRQIMIGQGILAPQIALVLEVKT